MQRELDKGTVGTFLMVQRLTVHAPTAGGVGWIPHSTWISVVPPNLIFYFCISRCS